MSFWQHLIGRAQYLRGWGAAMDLIKKDRALGQLELLYELDRYGVADGVKYFRGFAQGYNSFVVENSKGASLEQIKFRNPYQVGIELAEQKKTFPKKIISQMLKGKSLADGKNALRLLTDGYNTRFREISRKSAPEKNKQVQQRER